MGGGNAGSAAEGGADGIAGDAGIGGVGGGSGGSGGDCDTSASPNTEPCLISDDRAIFVAPTGSDNDAGTRRDPLRTITKAVALAQAEGKIVIACSATYDDALSLTAGVRLYGGFACPDDSNDTPWAYQPEAPTVVAPTTAGLALEIRNVKDAIRVEDVVFEAQDATAPGDSSVAALVENAPDVTLARVRLVAGKGAAGTAGTTGAKGEDAADVGVSQRGGNANCTLSAPNIQPGGRSSGYSDCGSRGGDGGPSSKGGEGYSGAPGEPRTHVTPPDIDNGGIRGPVGGDGAPGSHGDRGTPGEVSSKAGTFSPNGFTPAPPGGDGTDGFPGQGGGGGGGSNGYSGTLCLAASGGAGGRGGCGGRAGTGGASGGASIALVSWQSSITLDACELVASNGGPGGKGGDGGNGGLGKAGAEGGAPLTDSGSSVGKGGHGGDGGNGGNGGPGAGGNGGPSYVLVVHGDPPTRINDTLLTPGKGGARGAGGIATTIRAANGTVGDSRQLFTVP